MVKIVDSSEPYQIREQLLQLGWTQQRLHTGDYTFNTIDGKTVGIERKEVSDLLNSLGNRLSTQILCLIERYDIAILLVEGKWSRVYGERILTASGIRQWSWDTVWNFLQTWQDRGVTVQLTVSGEHTIHRLNSLYAYYQKHVHSGGLPRTAAGDPRLLAFPSGIGPELAQLLLRKFGSLRAIASATAEELLTVEGIGLKRAQAIHDYYNRRYDGDTIERHTKTIPAQSEAGRLQHAEAEVSGSGGAAQAEGTAP